MSFAFVALACTWMASSTAASDVAPSPPPPAPVDTLPDEGVDTAPPTAMDVAADPVDQRPWVAVKGAIGLPNLGAVYVEAYVLEELTLELGVGTGLLPPVVEGSLRWRPHFTCWGCDDRQSRHRLSVGFGVDPAVYLSRGPFDVVRSGFTDVGNVGLMLVPTVDVMYAFRLLPWLGLLVGTRWGAGAVVELGDGTPFRVEPALKVNLLQVGLLF